MNYRHARLILAVLLMMHLPLLNFIQPAASAQASSLYDGVVKITNNAKQVGTGFVVCIRNGSAYIITADHVTNQANSVDVSIHSDAYTSYKAQVLFHSQREDIALIQLKESIVSKLTRLEFDLSDANSGNAISLIGFPISGGAWNLIKGNISSQEGSDILFYPSVQRGYSGAPLLRNGKVIGLVTSSGGDSGRAIPASNLRQTLRGWQFGDCIASYSYKLTGWIDSIDKGTVKRTPIESTTSDHMPKFHFPGTFYKLYVLVEQLTNGVHCTQGEVRESPHMLFHDHQTGSRQGEPRPTLQGGCQVENDQLAFYINPSTECN